MSAKTKSGILKYPVIEIFTSIQGEGVFSGEKATFVRFAGCNLTCAWCDTKESWVKPCSHPKIAYGSPNEMRSSDMSCAVCGAEGTREELEELLVSNGNFTWMSAAGIVARIVDGAEHVVLTGGEPAMHDLTELVDALEALNIIPSIETNGSIEFDRRGFWVTASPKPPLYELKVRADEIKYVVDDQFDPDKHISLEARASEATIFLQVESAKPESAQRAYDMVMAEPRFKLGIQLHKVLNVR